MVAEYLFSKKSSCHCRTIPRQPLLSTATLTGMSLTTAVASSWLFMRKLPSPATSMTSHSGRPILAPMAAGNPYPMVPRPPEDMNLDGSLCTKNCAAHIWFCPTSVVMMASGAISHSFSITYWGLMIFISGM